MFQKYNHQKVIYNNVVHFLFLVAEIRPSSWGCCGPRGHMILDYEKSRQLVAGAGIGAVACPACKKMFGDSNTMHEHYRSNKDAVHAAHRVKTQPKRNQLPAAPWPIARQAWVCHMPSMTQRPPLPCSPALLVMHLSRTRGKFICVKRSP